MLQGEHSAILSTFIKLPFVIKIFVLSILEWLLYTGFTVCVISLSSFLSCWLIMLALMQEFLWPGCTQMSLLSYTDLQEYWKWTGSVAITRRGLVYYSLLVECLTRDLGAAGSSPPASLHCVLEQDTFILALGSTVVECLTRDWRATGLSLTGVTVLWSLSKTHLSLLSTGSTQEDPSLYNWKIVDRM